jgi:hypothetical protein
MRSLTILIPLLASTAYAAPTERRLHTDSVEASTFLWNDWNKFVENYHPNYLADDDAATAWVEGAKSSGAGEWVRINVTPLDGTTKLRLKIKNGYQKSKDLFKANARAKDVTVKLLPSKVEKTATLVDKDGYQELVIEQPKGELRAVELAIGSVYEGSKYPDLCITDLQVFATSETVENPAFEKGKREKLLAWRAARLAAAKLFKGKTDIPLHPAYETTSTALARELAGIDIAAMVTAASEDKVFATEWKEALAIASAAAKSPDAMTRVQIAPRSATKLVPVDGVQITHISDIATGEGPYLNGDTFRLPMLGTVAVLFADQLRVLDIKDKQTPTAFASAKGLCKDTFWAHRKDAKEGPSQLQAVIVGRCAKVEGREGSWNARVTELVVYDATGKAVLVVGDGHIEGYRWATDGAKPMIASARSLLALNSVVIEAKKREAVAAAK